MAAMRCSSCNLNCPITVPKCPICGGETWRSTGDPDSDFHARVTAHRNPQPVASAPPGIHPSRLVHHCGQEWIGDDDLEKCGYPYAQVGDILRVQGDDDLFYEIDGPATYTQTLGSQAGWWISPIVPEGWVPDAPPEA